MYTTVHSYPYHSHILFVVIDRGLTSRRFVLLQNKHFSKCDEAKQLAKDWQMYFAKKRREDLESISKWEWE
jgi:hypothetical protein